MGAAAALGRGVHGVGADEGHRPHGVGQRQDVALVTEQDVAARADLPQDDAFVPTDHGGGGVPIESVDPFGQAEQPDHLVVDDGLLDLTGTDRVHQRLSSGPSGPGITMSSPAAACRTQPVRPVSRRLVLQGQAADSLMKVCGHEPLAP